MRNLTQLDAVEHRILGALMEKGKTTPDYYPLTLKALVAACNQKSNRNPVMSLAEIEVLNTLRVLLQEGLVQRVGGARVDRWQHRLGDSLSEGALAVLTLLLLRGAQTLGELRGRAERLHGFASLSEVETALQELKGQDPPLSVELARLPGQKENRWTFCGEGEEPQVQAIAAAPEAAGSQSMEERIDRLEAQVGELRRELDDLKHQLGSD